MVMLPICLENQLASGTLEFAIHTLVETRMDLSVFDAKYKNDEMGSLSQDSFIFFHPAARLERFLRQWR